MELEQPLPGELAEPRVERQRPVPQVVGQALRGVGQRLLHHVGGIDPGRHPAVDAQRDHLPQPAPMPRQQLLPGRLIARTRSLDQFFGVGLLRRVHRVLPTMGSAKRGGKVTDFFKKVTK